MPTAFVLSGGAALGAVQVGMLQALHEHGVATDMVIGTSVGAINAAWIAHDPHGATLDDLATLWRSLRRNQIFPTSASGLFGMLGRRQGLFDQRPLRRLLTKHLPPCTCCRLVGRACSSTRRPARWGWRCTACPCSSNTASPTMSTTTPTPSRSTSCHLRARSVRDRPISPTQMN